MAEPTIKDLLKFDSTEFAAMTAEHQTMILESIAYRGNMINEETGAIDISDIARIKDFVRIKFAEWIDHGIDDAIRYKANLTQLAGKPAVLTKQENNNDTTKTTN